MLGFGSRLSGFFSSGGSGGTPPPTKVFGSFYDTTDQTVAINGVKAIELNSTDGANTYGAIIDNNALGRTTRIRVIQSGTYDLQFSAQILRTSGGNRRRAVFWIRVNENNIPETSTFVTLQANADYLVAAWNFFVRLNANQYVELMWTQDDDITLAQEPEDLIIPYPAVPSAIVTIQQV